MTRPKKPPPSRREVARTELVEVAAELLRVGGAAAVTTRAVASAAGVQAPTLYRLFGDKEGLLDAVAEHLSSQYMAGKAASPRESDPLADLRLGWSRHLQFGLANPALFVLMADPSRPPSAASATGLQVLGSRVQRLAAVGRLRVPEAEAVDLLRAAGTGVVLTLLGTPAAERDLSLGERMFDTVLRTILNDAPAAPKRNALAAAAATLKAGARELAALTPAERALLLQWLERISG